MPPCRLDGGIHAADGLDTPPVFRAGRGAIADRKGSG
jgi:hypothetical protein